MVAGEGQAPHIYLAKNTKVSEDYEISYVIDIDYIHWKFIYSLFPAKGLPKGNILSYHLCVARV